MTCENETNLKVIQSVMGLYIEKIDEMIERKRRLLED